MTSDCLFCRILAGEIPSNFLYQDERAVAVRDINPRAPTHLLVLPREHIATTTDVAPEQEAIVGHLVWVAARLAEREGLVSRGYRLVFNCGADAGQAVFHLHLHLLGGRGLGRMG